MPKSLALQMQLQLPCFTKTSLLLLLERFNRFLYMTTPACPAGCKLLPVISALFSALRTMSHNPTFQTRGSQFLESYATGVCGVCRGQQQDQPRAHKQGQGSSPIISLITYLRLQDLGGD